MSFSPSQSLPSELLLHILLLAVPPSETSPPTHLLTFISTCRYFRDLVLSNDRLLWSDHVRTKWPRLVQERGLLGDDLGRGKGKELLRKRSSGKGKGTAETQKTGYQITDVNEVLFERWQCLTIPESDTETRLSTSSSPPTNFQTLYATLHTLDHLFSQVFYQIVTGISSFPSEVSSSVFSASRSESFKLSTRFTLSSKRYFEAARLLDPRSDIGIIKEDGYNPVDFLNRVFLNTDPSRILFAHLDSSNPDSTSSSSTTSPSASAQKPIIPTPITPLDSTHPLSLRYYSSQFLRTLHSNQAVTLWRKILIRSQRSEFEDMMGGRKFEEFEPATFGGGAEGENGDGDGGGKGKLVHLVPKGRNGRGECSDNAEGGRAIREEEKERDGPVGVRGGDFVDAMKAFEIARGVSQVELDTLFASMFLRARIFLRCKGLLAVEPDDEEEDKARYESLKNGPSLSNDTPTIRPEAARVDIAIAIAEFMTEEGYGVLSPERFHDPHARFLSSILSKNSPTNRKSIPMMSCALFISIAQYFGVPSQPIAFPGSIVASVPIPNSEEARTDFIMKDLSTVPGLAKLTAPILKRDKLGTLRIYLLLDRLGGGIGLIRRIGEVPLLDRQTLFRGLPHNINYTDDLDWATHAIQQEDSDDGTDREVKRAAETLLSWLSPVPQVSIFVVRQGGNLIASSQSALPPIPGSGALLLGRRARLDLVMDSFLGMTSMGALRGQDEALLKWAVDMVATREGGWRTGMGVVRHALGVRPPWRNKKMLMAAAMAKAGVQADSDEDEEGGGTEEEEEEDELEDDRSDYVETGGFDPSVIFNPDDSMALERLEGSHLRYHASNMLQETEKKARNDDEDEANLRRRGEVHPKFRVGDIFRHKRYHYKAIIISWDAECLQSQSWQTSMRVNNLSRGSTQPFYSSIDLSTRNQFYVAEENIRPIVTITNDEDGFAIPALRADRMQTNDDDNSGGEEEEIRTPSVRQSELRDFFIAMEQSGEPLGRWFDTFDGQRLVLGAEMKERYPDD